MAPGFILFIFAFAGAAASENTMSTATRDRYPQVIAHRGASGYIPEHSLQAYQTAMDLQGDYIEPDLCLSKDGVFVALHDVLLDDTTNVATLPQFASRKTTRVVDGEEMTGWFVNDFLFEELQQLTLHQRLPFRTPLYNNVFRIPSLQEIANLVTVNYNTTQRLVGLYIEPKNPRYFTSLGWDVEAMLLQQLKHNGFRVSGAPRNLKGVVPVVIQCFEADTLRRLKTHTDIPLVLLLNPPTSAQLVDGSYFSHTFLAEASTYADGLGPEKTLFSTLSLENARQMVEGAHGVNLSLHPWTFRAEPQYIGKKFNSDFELEQVYYLCCLGMDGLFSEFPDRSREVVDGLVRWWQEGREGCPVDCQTVALSV